MNQRTFLVTLTESEVIIHLETKLEEVRDSLYSDIYNLPETRDNLDHQISELIKLRMLLDDMMLQPKTLSVVSN
jgi:hypothetical protein